MSPLISLSPWVLLGMLLCSMVIGAAIALIALSAEAKRCTLPRTLPLPLDDCDEEHKDDDH